MRYLLLLLTLSACAPSDYDGFRKLVVQTAQAHNALIFNLCKQKSLPEEKCKDINEADKAQK